MADDALVDFPCGSSLVMLFLGKFCLFTSGLKYRRIDVGQNRGYSRRNCKYSGKKNGMFMSIFANLLHIICICMYVRAVCEKLVEARQ